jgi:hypothetical protein
MSKRYKNIEIIRNSEFVRYKPNIIYPIIPIDVEDIYVTSVVEDRYDLLARQYYKNSKLWWVISLANPNLAKDSYYITPGNQVRIPSNVEGILNEITKLNS